MNIEVRDERDDGTAIVAGRRLYTADVAWALRCMLKNNVSQKFHAGCNFTYVDGRIHMSNGEGGHSFTLGGAREFVEEYGR